MRGFDVDDSVAEPTEVHLSRIDVPFLELTWFFIKASLAMALAFSVTSWLWVMIGTGMITLSAGLLFLMGVPRLFANPAPEIPIPAVVAPVPLPAPPPVEPAPVVEETPVAVEHAPAPAPPPPVPEAVVPLGDPNRDATEAAQLEELERIRRERRGR